MDKLILLSSCLIAVMADMCLVWWAKSPKHPYSYFTIGVVLTMIGLTVWAYSMRRGIESAMAITSYSLLTVAGCTFIGVMVFKESMTTMNMAGIALAAVALVMISV
jgi:multidrug transporter EmrE-like cation transporter